MEAILKGAIASPLPHELKLSLVKATAATIPDQTEEAIPRFLALSLEWCCTGDASAGLDDFGLTILRALALHPRMELRLPTTFIELVLGAATEKNEIARRVRALAALAPVIIRTPALFLSKATKESLVAGVVDFLAAFPSNRNRLWSGHEKGLLGRVVALSLWATSAASAVAAAASSLPATPLPTVSVGGEGAADLDNLLVSVILTVVGPLPDPDPAAATAAAGHGWTPPSPALGLLFGSLPSVVGAKLTPTLLANWPRTAVGDAMLARAVEVMASWPLGGLLDDDKGGGNGASGASGGKGGEWDWELSPSSSGVGVGGAAAFDVKAPFTAEWVTSFLLGLGAAKRHAALLEAVPAAAAAVAAQLLVVTALQPPEASPFSPAPPSSTTAPLLSSSLSSPLPLGNSREEERPPTLFPKLLSFVAVGASLAPALALLERLLWGFQHSPHAFHQVLPALLDCAQRLASATTMPTTTPTTTAAVTSVEGPEREELSLQQGGSSPTTPTPPRDEGVANNSSSFRRGTLFRGEVAAAARSLGELCVVQMSLHPGYPQEYGGLEAALAPLAKALAHLKKGQSAAGRRDDDDGNEGSASLGNSGSTPSSSPSSSVSLSSTQKGEGEGQRVTTTVTATTAAAAAMMDEAFGCGDQLVASRKRLEGQQVGAEARDAWMSDGVALALLRGGGGGGGGATGVGCGGVGAGSGGAGAVVAAAAGWACVRGLSNLGNTCYLNSLLQCLACNGDFRRFLLLPAPPPPESGPRPLPANAAAAAAARKTLTQQLRHTLAVLSPGSGSLRPSLSPRALHSCLPPPFNSTAQQDSAELLRILLDRLEEKAVQVHPPAAATAAAAVESGRGGATTTTTTTTTTATTARRRRRAIQDVFSGCLETRVTCRTCGHVSSRPEPFSDLCLPFPANPASSSAPFPLLTLEGLLGRLLAPEAMEGSEAYACEACAEACWAAKTKTETQRAAAAVKVKAAAAATSATASTATTITGIPTTTTTNGAEAATSSVEQVTPAMETSTASPEKMSDAANTTADDAAAAAAAEEEVDALNDAVVVDDGACRQPADRVTVLTAAPAHLVLCLSRFQYDFKAGARLKLGDPVSFPLTLRVPVEVKKAAVEKIVCRDDDDDDDHDQKLPGVVDNDNVGGLDGYSPAASVEVELAMDHGDDDGDGRCSHGRGQQQQGGVEEAARQQQQLKRSRSGDGRLVSSMKEEDQHPHRHPTTTPGGGGMGAQLQVEVEGMVRYGLYGLIVHAGRSAQAGHYYAYARESDQQVPTRPVAGVGEKAAAAAAAVGGASSSSSSAWSSSGQWRLYNDERVVEVPRERIEEIGRSGGSSSSDTPYLLFYRRLDDDDAGGSSVPSNEKSRASSKAASSPPLTETGLSSHFASSSSSSSSSFSFLAQPSKNDDRSIEIDPVLARFIADDNAAFLREEHPKRVRVVPHSNPVHFNGGGGRGGGGGGGGCDHDEGGGFNGGMGLGGNWGV